MLNFTVYDYPVVGSTNDEVKSLWAQGALEGTVVRAQRQTAGRGRQGSQMDIGTWKFILLPSLDAPLSLSSGKPAVFRNGNCCGGNNFAFLSIARAFIL